MLKRIITALVGVPIVGWTIVNGGIWFSIGAALLSFVAWRELFQMLSLKGYRAISFGWVLNLVCVVAASADLAGVATVWAIAFILSFLYALYRHEQEGWLVDMAVNMWGFVYTGVLFAHFVLLRNFEPLRSTDTVFGMLSPGEALIWVAVLGTWASDTFAYFFGIALGKHKACPSISPKKSWEGYIAGFICSILTVVYVGKYLFNFDYVLLATMGVVIAILAPLGDLMESLLKRYTGVKDSGNCFPGHGGVLDRLDSLLIVLPAVYYVVVFLYK